MIVTILIIRSCCGDDFRYSDCTFEPSIWELGKEFTQKKSSGPNNRVSVYSPPQVDRIWAIWGS